MKKHIGIALAAILALSAPASAQWHGGGHGGGGWHGGHGGYGGWHGGHRGGGWGGVGPAIGLGVLGLGAMGAYQYERPRCPEGYYMASNGVCYPEY